MSPAPDAARAKREWLDVPYAHKDAAKAAGARWDAQEKRWFAPRPGMTQLAKWAARNPLPELLPGEDRRFGSGLFVDLIPSSCWFSNVRSCIVTEDWDRVRRMVYARAGQRCEACNGQRDRAAEVWLEAHERWDYDEVRCVQRLRRLVCLCTRCHEVTHFGRATIMGTDRRALGHLMSVNRWTAATARHHVDAAFRQWERRNARDWTLDLTMLTAAGITLAEPPQAAQRRAHAQEVLHNTSTPATLPTPGPGWFADPSARFPYRWWDGQAWRAEISTDGYNNTGLDPL